MPRNINSHSRRQKWRTGFHSRLQKSKDFLQGNQAIAITQERHINAFAQVLSEKPLYRKEVENLTTFEFEMLCIASTDNQAMRDAEYFRASELEASLPCGFVKAERRDEVRTTISNISPYLESIYTITQTNGSIATECWLRLPLTVR